MNIITLQVGPIGTNCYLVCDGAAKLCAVVDPGGEADRVTAAAEQAGCTVACILLTHGHYDHTGGVAELRERFPDVPVYMNHNDIHAPDSRESRLFLPLPGEILDLQEGDDIPVGSLRFSVLYTPGHSEGSVTLRCGDALLCGDTLFAGSCGRTDLHGGSMEKMLESLRRLGQLEGSLLVLPGHMDPSDLTCERMTNPYLRQAMRG